MDVMCFDDLDEFGRDLNDPLAELDQDVIHMLIETFGSNPDVPTRGVGLVSQLSGVADPAGLARKIVTQLNQDPRITASTASVTETATPGEYRVDLSIVVNETELGVAFNVDSAGNVQRIITT